jgi:hypothetical protein
MSQPKMHEYWLERMNFHANGTPQNRSISVERMIWTTAGGQLLQRGAPQRPAADHTTCTTFSRGNEHARISLLFRSDGTFSVAQIISLNKYMTISDSHKTRF